MTESRDSKILYAINILLILLILVIVISVLYEKYENNNNNKKHTLELFANYQDVKTKTINWCKKMYKVGLLTPDQFNQCISTYKDSTSGILPSEFTVPNTGLSRNFSLYNTTSARVDSDQLSSSISGSSTNNVMLVTQTGLYMGCKSDNTLYFIKNINDSTINQQELYFTLVPQSSDTYAIMSPYERYLIASVNPEDDTSNKNTNDTNVGYTSNDTYIIDKTGNIIPITTNANLLNVNPVTTKKNINTKEWTASFTGTSIGPMSTWKVALMENNKAIFESLEYSDSYVSFNDANNSLEIIKGNNDSSIWQMIPEEQHSSSNNSAYTGNDLIVGVENILQKYKNNHTNIMCLKASISGLENLKTNIFKNYRDIAEYMATKMGQLSINQNDMNTVIKKITDMSTNYSSEIQTEIDKFNLKLTKLIKEDSDNIIEYNNYVEDLKNKVNVVLENINNNNQIMGRQQDNFVKINKDYVDINKKTQKINKIDETSNLNIDLISAYSKNNKLYVKIYPFIILILILLLLYLSYSTIMKFKHNIYHKY